MNKRSSLITEISLLQDKLIRSEYDSSLFEAWNLLLVECESRLRSSALSPSEFELVVHIGWSLSTHEGKHDDALRWIGRYFAYPGVQPHERVTTVPIWFLGVSSLLHLGQHSEALARTYEIWEATTRPSFLRVVLSHIRMTFFWYVERQPCEQRVPLQIVSMLIHAIRLELPEQPTDALVRNPTCGRFGKWHATLVR